MELKFVKPNNLVLLTTFIVTTITMLSTVMVFIPNADPLPYAFTLKAAGSSGGSNDNPDDGEASDPGNSGEDSDSSDDDDSDSGSESGDVKPPPDPRSNPSLPAADSDDDGGNDNDRPEAGEAAAEESPTQIDAGVVYKSQNIELDGDVENLVILIPDNSINREFHNRNNIDSPTHAYLPQEASIVQGTKVIWLNTDPDITHSLVIGMESGISVFADPSIPYRGSTEFIFNELGQFNFSDTLYPFMKGTVNVVKNAEAKDIISTNSDTSTIGLFIASEEEREYFERYFSEAAGHHLISSTSLPKGVESVGASNTLYVWGQESPNLGPLAGNATMVAASIINNTTGN